MKKINLILLLMACGFSSNIFIMASRPTLPRTIPSGLLGYVPVTEMDQGCTDVYDYANSKGYTTADQAKQILNQSVPFKGHNYKTTDWCGGDCKSLYDSYSGLANQNFINDMSNYMYQANNLSMTCKDPSPCNYPKKPADDPCRGLYDACGGVGIMSSCSIRNKRNIFSGYSEVAKNVQKKFDALPICLSKYGDSGDDTYSGSNGLLKCVNDYVSKENVDLTLTDSDLNNLPDGIKDTITNLKQYIDEINKFLTSASSCCTVYQKICYPVWTEGGYCSDRNQPTPSSPTISIHN